MKQRRHHLDRFDPLIETPKKENLFVQIPEELKASLQAEADRRDITLVKLVTHILVNWFKK